MHHYGDGFEYFNDVESAASYIGDYLRKWGRVGVRQTKEKYGCYDEQTEVLTKSGWKFFKDVDINTDEFATLQDDEFLEYKKASEYVKYEYSGKMYSINTRGVDLLVTPEHKLYVAESDKNGGIENSGHKESPFLLEDYTRLYRKHKKFKKGATWKGTDLTHFELPSYENSWIAHNTFVRNFKQEARRLPIRPWLQFLGWFVAEGYVSKECQVVLCLNGTDDGVEASKVKQILNQLEFEFTEKTRESATILTIYSTQLGLFLNQECGQLAENKKTPSFIKELTAALIKTYLECLYEGDGWQTETALTLSTVSKILADDVLELLLKAGYCGRIASRDRQNNPVIRGRTINHNFPEITVRWLEKTLHHSSNSHDSQVDIQRKEQLIDYTGNVYCVTVPGHILYVRRNGKAVWCGNTVRVYCGLGWSQLHSITHPGHCFGRYPQWLWSIDCLYLSKVVRLLNFIVVPYHKWLYNKAYQNAIMIWPHIKEEILVDADWAEFIEGNDEIMAAHWTSFDKDGNSYPWKKEKK